MFSGNCLENMQMLQHNSWDMDKILAILKYTFDYIQGLKSFSDFVILDFVIFSSVVFLRASLNMIYHW